MGVRIREKKKGSGVWWLFINHKGRRASRKVGSLEAAQAVKQQIEARLVLGQGLPEEEPTPKAIPTLEAYFQGLLDTHFDMAVADSTRESYEGNFRLHILPELGGLELRQITRDRVKAFVAHLLKKTYNVRKVVKETLEDGTAKESETIEERPLSRPSIRIIVAELCAVLNHAREDGHIQNNPAARLSKFYKKAKVVHDEIQPLTAHEVLLFLQAVQAAAPHYYPLFLCALHTGMRSGEIAALRWSDIDFAGKFIRLQKNLSRGKVGDTKTGKTRRVDISDELISTLEALRRTRRAEYLQRGSNEIPEWVFLSPGRLEKDEETGKTKRAEGRRVDMHNVKTRCFHACLAKAGLRRIRFHDLRHTYATLLLMQGESPAYVRDQLGHTSIKMTVDIYGHWIPGANRQAVNRLPSLGSLAIANRA